MKSVITMQKWLLLFFAIIAALAVSAQNLPFKETSIGNQVWMDRNLNVTHFRNGDEIPHASTAREWQQAAERGNPAWCFYNNDPNNEASYGRLYNWYAITDPRGFGPEGWRVPSDYDWGVLERHLGMSMVQLEQFEWRGTDQGNKLRQEGRQFWRAPNAGANNQSGFTALPGGYRQPGGVFETMGVYGSWWTSTPQNDQNAYYRDLSAMHAGVYRGAYPKGCGFSVRLIKANGTGSQVLPDLNDTRDGNVYKVVRIGNKAWMAENLRYLPQVHNNNEFAQAGKDSQPGYGVAGYNGSNIETAKSHENYQKYGVLYNWWAVTDICPAGWHLPSDSEWTELSDYLLGEIVAGTKLKSTSGWNDGGNGTNSSGFNGLPGGMRNDAGLSDRMGSFGYWWSSTEYTSSQSYARLLDQGEDITGSRAWARRLSSRDAEVSRNHSSKVPGRSVRCITNIESFHEIHPHQRVDNEPAGEREAGLVQNLERPMGFVVEEPDSIDIQDSLSLIVGEMPIQGVGQEGHPPGPSQDTGQGQQLEEPGTLTEDPHHGQGLQKIKDVDDNEYSIVKIGNQIWMTDNLRVSRFRNGDPIANIISGDDWDAWKGERKPAYSYYENNPSFDKEFGKLYNWHTVNDSRGICPVGWRVPSESDWRTLVGYLGTDVAGYKLKSTSGWRIVTNSCENGNNQSGFNGKPGGHRYASGFLGFTDMYSNGNWWASNRDYLGSAWRFRLLSFSKSYDLGSYSPDNAYSIRCIKE